MATAYERLFGVRSLNGMVEVFAQEAQRNRQFQSLFMDKGRRLEPDGQLAEWDEVQMHRHLAPVVGRDAPHKSVQHTTRIARESAMCHVKLAKEISAPRLYEDREAGTLRPDAAAVVDRELRDMVKLISNTIEYLAVNTLNGTLTVNASNIPGTEVPFTLSYSPNTYAASNAWTTAGTDVIGAELLALKNDFEQTSGFPAARVITTGTIAAGLAQNTDIQTLLQYSMGPGLANSASERFNEWMPQLMLGGLEWSINEAGYVPEGGSFTKFIPATDDAFVLPSDDNLRDTLGMALGRGYLPSRSLGPAASAASLVMPAPQRGFYSYAEDVANPAGVRLYVGWVGLPVLLYPNGVCVADLVP